MDGQRECLINELWFYVVNKEDDCDVAMGYGEAHLSFSHCSQSPAYTYNQAYRDYIDYMSKQNTAHPRGKQFVKIVCRDTDDVTSWDGSLNFMWSLYLRTECPPGGHILSGPNHICSQEHFVTMGESDRMFDSPIKCSQDFYSSKEYLKLQSAHSDDWLMLVEAVKMNWLI